MRRSVIPPVGFTENLQPSCGGTPTTPKAGPETDPYPAGRCFTRRQILTSNTSTATYHAALSRMIGMTSIGMKLKKNPLSMRGCYHPAQGRGRLRRVSIQHRLLHSPPTRPESWAGTDALRRDGRGSSVSLVA